MNWEIFWTIAITSIVGGVASALVCICLLTPSAKKYRWNGHILVTTDTQPEWSWQNAGPPPRHMTTILPTESRLTAVRLCGARAGNLPLVQVKQRDKKSRLLYGVGFFLRPSHNDKDTDIVLLTPAQGEDVRIEIYDELDTEGHLEPAHEFDIEWQRVSVLA